METLRAEPHGTETAAPPNAGIGPIPPGDPAAAAVARPGRRGPGRQRQEGNADG